MGTCLVWAPGACEWFDVVGEEVAVNGWLADLLYQSTGQRLPVRGVVLYPGWRVERTNRERHSDVQVLKPKALPAWIEKSPASIAAKDVAMAAFHLSRYVRGAGHQKW